MVTETDRERLRSWSQRATSAQSLALRAKIILMSAEGAANTEVAARLGCNHGTVGKWRRRFVERGLDGLLDEPRPGGPRTVSDEQVEQLVGGHAGAAPRPTPRTGRGPRWRPRTGLSKSTVGRIWRAFGLQAASGRRPSNSVPTRCSSTRSATSSGCT